MGNITNQERIKRIENQLRFHTDIENKSMTSILTARLEKLKAKESLKKS